MGWKNKLCKREDDYRWQAGLVVNDPDPCWLLFSNHREKSERKRGSPNICRACLIVHLAWIGIVSCWVIVISGSDSRGKGVQYHTSTRY